MLRPAAILLLCLIVFSEAACARRHARGLRLRSSDRVAAAQRSPRSATDPAARMNEAIRSLKGRMGGAAAGTEGTPSAGDVSVIQPGVTPAAPAGSVGTSGAWSSVESRSPAAQPGAPAQSRGRLLSRAADAVRDGAGGSWALAIALCCAAGLLVLALLRRRSRQVG